MNDTWWVSEGQMDDDQKRVVALPLDRGQLVVGPPGSGKTNLLVLRAKYLTLAGRPNFQIVVFTRALREFIAAGADAYGVPGDKIVTSKRFFAGVLYDYGVKVESVEDFGEQRRKLVEQVAGVVQREGLRNIYDAILLDEAHDYLPEEVELFARLSTTLFAVADRRQKIYSGEEPFGVLESIVGDKVELTHHYRNGVNVCRFADRIGRDREAFQPIEASCNYNEKDRPSSVRWERCASLDEEIELVISRLSGQIAAYPDERVGIISPSRSAAARMWAAIEQTEFADVASFQGDDEVVRFDEDVRICVSSLHAAKGLEYRVLHVLSCENFARRPLPRFLAFTAVTRAKTALYMYFSGELLGFLDQAIQSLETRPSPPSIERLFGDKG
ncbi:MAG: AAA family ATPase [Gemmatimonadetes bacterium]|nr:AAA family ATPase [Gammaproteobacteria bacterium]MYK41497.1 AAA family ATPase [Gemmatimonadota bacterium]